MHCHFTDNVPMPSLINDLLSLHPTGKYRFFRIAAVHHMLESSRVFDA